jgi:DNA helicase-2/ATP-dependent DNA helicase PcrA
MDKRIILAVAGSGKTTYLVDNIPKDKRSLLLTYTEANTINLRNNIIKIFNYFPEYITLKTYFSFLYSFCIQPFLKDEYKLKGLLYKQNENMYAKDDKRYLTKKGYLFYNRAAKFLEVKGLYNDIQKRLEKYYQYIFIDEIQDFASHDFNLLEKISCANINILYAGDFYQHTFDTSRDGNVKQSLYHNYEQYKKIFDKINIVVDETTLKKSYRCSPKTCEYIKKNLNIHIESHGEKSTEIKYITNKTEIDTIIRNDSIIKLFYRQHYLYKCRSRNWGDCKGENIFNDVCVVLNKISLDYYLKNKLRDLLPQTLNKLYVAISRAHGNVYFVAEKDLEEYKLKA